jgi:hypothetical protein
MDSGQTLLSRSDLRRFNGATSFQKWIAFVNAVREQAKVGCFNGATSFQKWIGNLRNKRLVKAIWFQWSHFFSEMDRLALR